MRILDTHALYWWVNQSPGKLGKKQINAIETADQLAISAMTCWEMAWLVNHGRIVLRLPLSEWLDQVLESGISALSVTHSIAILAANLPEHHRDPADRLIIATAIEHRAQLVSVDERFPDYVELSGLLIGIGE